jgi:hypothetical protein
MKLKFLSDHGLPNKNGERFLEPHSQTSDTEQSRVVLEDQIRELYGRTVYSHKTHEKCADNHLAWQANLRIAQIALSALTTAGFVAVIFGGTPYEKIAGLFISIVMLCITSYSKDYDRGELAQKHRQVGSDLWLAREQLQSLLVDIAMRERPIENLQTQRDALISSLHKIYRSAPSTNSKSYRKAQADLKYNEAMNFSEDEIDRMLPQSLRRDNKS